MNIKEKERQIKEYDKQVFGSVVFILSIILFVIFQFWISGILGIA